MHTDSLKSCQMGLLVTPAVSAPRFAGVNWRPGHAHCGRPHAPGSLSASGWWPPRTAWAVRGTCSAGTGFPTRAAAGW